MSLDFDLSGIERKSEHFPPDSQGKMNDALHVAIWMTIPIGISRFTDENIAEVWQRIDMWQRVAGSGFTVWHEDHSDPQPYVLRKEYVVNMVGLHTNANHKTMSQFLKDLANAHVRTHPLES